MFPCESDRKVWKEVPLSPLRLTINKAFQYRTFGIMSVVLKFLSNWHVYMENLF